LEKYGRLLNASVSMKNRRQEVHDYFAKLEKPSVILDNK
jgi:hypothetical protein